MRMLSLRTAWLLLAGGLVVAGPQDVMALAEAGPVQVAIDSYGDYQGYVREQGFVQGQDFALERAVAPGVTHRFESRAQGPRTFHAVEVDLSRDDLMLETEKGQGIFYGRERLSDMSRRLADPDARPLVLINADFWGDRSVPVGLFVDEGTIWRGPWGFGAGRPRAAFAFDEEGNLFIGIPDWSTELTNGDGTESLPLASVNLVPGEDFEAMAFTWPLGESAPAAGEGQTAVVLSLPGGQWLPNAPATATVQSVGEEGAIPLDRERVIIHLRGEAPSWLEPGSEVVLSARLTQLPGRVLGVVGGGPILVQDGEVVAATAPEREAVSAAFVTDRHPRSAVGIKEDGKTIVMGVVDGRQTGLSIGINLPDLGEWMREQGCVVAMNLDGGGSSTLAVREEIVNFPSDPGGPRSVSNALVVRRTAPIGPVAHVGVQPRRALVPLGGQVGLTARMFDESLEHVEPWQAAGVTIDWEQAEPLAEGGVVTEEGVVILGREMPGTAVTVRARAVERAAVEAVEGETRRGRQTLAEGFSLVEVNAVERLEAQPNALLLTVGESLALDVSAYAPDGRRFPTSRGMFQVLSPPFVDWSDATGLVTAYAPGRGVIQVTFGGKLVRIPLAVDEFSERPIYTFDALPPGNVGEWISQTRANPETTGLTINSEDFKEGFASWDWSYGMAAGGISKIALPLNLPVPGEPLGFGVWIRGDGKGQWLRASITDATGQRTTLDFTDEQTGIDFDGEWRFLRASIQQAAPVGRPFRAPFRFDEIYVVQPREDRKTDGTIGIDGLKALFLPAVEE